MLVRSGGFKGSGQNYKRDLGTQWQGLNIQKSQWRLSHDDPISFYLNVTLAFPDLEAGPDLAYPRTTFAKFSPMKFDQSFRLGDFLSGGDDWLCINADASSLETVWTRFERAMRDAVFPAMDLMKSPEGLCTVLRRSPWLSWGATRRWLERTHPLPAWNPADRDQWRQDADGLWWGPGE